MVFAPKLKEEQNRLYSSLSFGVKTIEDLCENVSTLTHFGKEHRKTRMKIAASEPNWRIPSPPIVEKNLLKMTAAVIKHDVNHFSRENNGNATARQKP